MQSTKFGLIKKKISSYNKYIERSESASFLDELEFQ